MISLEDFFDDEAPAYAILSHTWGKEEVSFQNIQGPRDIDTSKLGYDKIARICKQALDDGLEYGGRLERVSRGVLGRGERYTLVFFNCAFKVFNPLRWSLINSVDSCRVRASRRLTTLPQLST